jgi:hypothetical protein
MKLVFIIIFLGSLRAVGEPEISIPKLPDLYLFQYDSPRRDPFVSAAARRTLVSAQSRMPGVVSGSAVQQYLQTITEAIQRELFIGGLSIGDENARSMAVINGVSFSEGDNIPLPIQSQQLQQLQELARTYGLPLENNGAQKESIFVQVGTIKVTGISIVLPGFKAALCELPYEGDRVPQPIQLERKHP